MISLPVFTCLLYCLHVQITVYCSMFRARSHQLYAELWLDFLSFAGLLVIHEMTSRLAGIVLRLWTHQGGHFPFICTHVFIYYLWDVLLLPRVRYTLYFCTLFLMQYCNL